MLVRRMQRISWTAKTSNEIVLGEARQLINRICKLQEKFFGLGRRITKLELLVIEERRSQLDY